MFVFKGSKKKGHKSSKHKRKSKKMKHNMGHESDSSISSCEDHPIPRTDSSISTELPVSIAMNNPFNTE